EGYEYGSFHFLEPSFLHNYTDSTVIPLVKFTSDKYKMGELAAPKWMSYLSWVVAIVIACLNIYLLYQTIFPGLLVE
ncbi:hypothetical protein ABNE95_11940, partial [Paenibacillus larvae]